MSIVSVQGREMTSKNKIINAPQHHQLYQVPQQQAQQQQQQEHQVQQQHHQGVFAPPQVLSDDIRRCRGVIQTLNLNPVIWSAEKYMSKFGVITEEHPFGDTVWAGMTELFYKEYDHKHYFTGGNLLIGWFLLPSAFSKQNARKPPQAGDKVWYPAVFCDYGGEDLYMACLHIVLVGCRPWQVSRSRTAHLRIARL